MENREQWALLANFGSILTDSGLLLITGRSWEWVKVRREHLKLYPHCANCGTTKWPEVHHIYPVGWPNGKMTEFDFDNLITLCGWMANGCHRMIGHLGDFRSMNPDVREECQRNLLKIKNRPYPKVA